MRKFLFLLTAGLAIARPACADPDGTAKRTAAALQRFGILNVALSVDCSLGLEQGGQRWIYRASPGEQSVLIMRTPKGEMRSPILRVRLTGDKRLGIVLASPPPGSLGTSYCASFRTAHTSPAVRPRSVISPYSA